MRGFMALLVACCLAVVGVRAQQQDVYAAVARITFPNVDLMRDNTFRWISITSQSVTPFGPGDRLRTGRQGRALLTFAEGVEFLVLPQSALTLEEFSLEEGALRIRANVVGTVVQRTTPEFLGADIQVGTVDFEITQPSAHYLIYSDADAPDIVTSSTGTVTLLDDDTPVNIAQGEGYRADEDAPLPFEPPYSWARLVGVLDGCPGTARTNDGRNLFVRDGAGTGWVAKDVVFNGEQVPLLAITFSGFWTRIQQGNTFGWVQTAALITACDDLRVVPDVTPEVRDIRVFEVNDAELPLLRPFYGDVNADAWFYAPLQEVDDARVVEDDD